MIISRKIITAAVLAGVYVGTTTMSMAAPAAPSTSKTGEKKPPLKIGVIASLTGAASEIGQNIVQGINFYLDQINHEMGGRHVELLIENDGCSSDKAKDNFQKLVEKDKVHIVTGICLSNIGHALLPQIEKSHVPTVVSIATGDDLTQRKRPKNLIRTQASASQLTFPLGDWAYKKMKYKRVATLSMSYQYGWDTVGGFQKTFEEAGGKVVQKIWAPIGFSDFSTYIKQIRPDVDAVFLSAVGAAAHTIPKQYHEIGPKLPLIGTGTSFDEGNFQQAGDALLGAVTCRQYTLNIDTPVNKKFILEFRAKHKDQEPTAVIESGYVSAMWIHKAIESLKGDTDNPEKLLAALTKVQLEAPRGPIKLDSYGSPVENLYIRKIERVGGKLKAPIIQTYKNVSQFWKYDPKKYLAEPSFSKDFPPCTHCTDTHAK